MSTTVSVERALANDNEVICPRCNHQFLAIPVNVQVEVEALRKALEESRKIIIEVCGVCAVPLPLATLERIDAALAARPGEPK